MVLTDDTICPEAVDRLREHATVRILDAYPNETNFAQACRDADAIVARLGVVSEAVIAAAPRLRIIARHGAGSDAVDVAAATRHGVVVTTTGGANAGAVAEYTFALLLGLLRKIPAADGGMRAGRWARTPQIGGGLEGSSLGIIGHGAVGARVARIAAGFGMQVLIASSLHRDSNEPGRLPLLDVLGRSDIVSLHLRLTEANAGLIDATALAAMKPGAVLVNTARGELVDEPALIAALRSGHLAGAALDTYAQEPLSPTSLLRRLPNVLLSPHVAGQTEDALRRVGLAAAQAVLDELAGRRPEGVLNPDAYAIRRNHLPQ